MVRKYGVVFQEKEVFKAKVIFYEKHREEVSSRADEVCIISVVFPKKLTFLMNFYSYYWEHIKEKIKK